MSSSVEKSPFEEDERSQDIQQDTLVAAEVELEVETPTKSRKRVRQTESAVDDEAEEVEDVEDAVSTNESEEAQQLGDTEISSNIREYLIIERTIKRANSHMANTRKRKRELAAKLLTYMSSCQQDELPLGQVSIKKDVVTGSKPHSQESLKKLLVEKGVENDDADLLAQAIMNQKETRPPKERLVVIGQ